MQDNGPLAIDEYPEEYYLIDDLTDRALEMVDALRASDPARAADMEKYRGRYEAGGDHVRSERFARQVRDGLFPHGTRCAPRHTEPGADVVAWDSLTAAQQLRLTDRLKAMDGDVGTRSCFSRFSAQRTELAPEWQAYVHHPRGWAYASNTPFRPYKTHTYAGGVRVPMVLAWPAGLPRAAGIPDACGNWPTGGRPPPGATRSSRSTTTGSFHRNRPSTERVLEEPVTLYPGTPTLERFRSSKLRSFTVDICLEHRRGHAGVLVAHGDQGGGYVVHVEDGLLCLSYNQC